MENINRLIKEYWQKTYRNQDIDYIQIKADVDETVTQSRGQKSYNYRRGATGRKINRCCAACGDLMLQTGSGLGESAGRPRRRCSSRPRGVRSSPLASRVSVPLLLCPAWLAGPGYQKPAGMLLLLLPLLLMCFIRIIYLFE